MTSVSMVRAMATAGALIALLSAACVAVDGTHTAAGVVSICALIIGLLMLGLAFIADRAERMRRSRNHPRKSA